MSALGIKMSPKWIEIPAHRVFVCSSQEFHQEFEAIDEEGKPVDSGQLVYRYIRKRDYKVFKPSRFVPTTVFTHDLVVMEEV